MLTSLQGLRQRFLPCWFTTCLLVYYTNSIYNESTRVAIWCVFLPFETCLKPLCTIAIVHSRKMCTDCATVSAYCFWECRSCEWSTIGLNSHSVISWMEGLVCLLKSFHIFSCCTKGNSEPWRTQCGNWTASSLLPVKRQHRNVNCHCLKIETNSVCILGCSLD